MGRLSSIRAALHPGSRTGGTPHSFFARWRSRPATTLGANPLSSAHTPVIPNMHDPASALGQIPSIQTPGAEGGTGELLGFSPQAVEQMPGLRAILDRVQSAGWTEDDIRQRPMLHAVLAGLQNTASQSPSRTRRAFGLALKIGVIGAIGTVAVMTPGSTMSLMLGSAVFSLGFGKLSLKVKNKTAQTLFRLAPTALTLGVMTYVLAGSATFLAPLNATVMTLGMGVLFAKNVGMGIRHFRGAFRNQRTLPDWERKSRWDIVTTIVLSQSAIFFTEVYFFYRTYFTFLSSPVDGSVALFQNKLGTLGMLGGFALGKYWDSRKAGSWKGGSYFSMRGIFTGMLGLMMGSMKLPGEGLNLVNAFGFPMMLFVWWGDLHACNGIGYQRNQILALSPPPNTPRRTYEETVAATRHDAGTVLWEKPTTVPHEWVLPTYLSEILPGYITRGVGNYTEAVVQWDTSPYESAANQTKILAGYRYMQWVRNHVRAYYEIVRGDYRSFDATYRAATGHDVALITREHERYADMLERLAEKYEQEAGAGERGTPRGVLEEARQMFNRDIVANKWEVSEDWSEEHDRMTDFMRMKAVSLRTQAAEIRSQLVTLTPEESRCLSLEELREDYLRYLNQFDWDLTFFARKIAANYGKEKSKEPNQMKTREQMGLMTYSLTYRDKRTGETKMDMIPSRTVRRRRRDWDHVQGDGYEYSTLADVPAEENGDYYRDMAQKISRHESIAFVLTDDHGRPIALELKDGRIVSWPSGQPGAPVTVDAFNQENQPFELLSVGQLGNYDPLTGASEPIWVTAGRRPKGFFATGIAMALDHHMWEVNYDAEHTMLRHYEESFPVLLKDMQRAFMKLTWFLEVDVETPFNGSHLAVFDRAEAKPVKMDFIWAPFEIRFRYKPEEVAKHPELAGEHVIPFGIEKFFVSELDKEGERQTWDKELMLQGSVRVERAEPFKRGEVRGIRLHLSNGKTAEFIKDGNKKESAYPHYLPDPDLIETVTITGGGPEEEQKPNVQVLMREERQGVLPFVRYTFADGSERWVKWYDHEERPFPEFDPQSVDYSSIEIEGDGEKRRLRFKARKWRGKMIEWNSRLFDLRGRRAKQYEIQSAKEWKGKDTVVAMRRTGQADPVYVETDVSLPEADFMQMRGDSMFFHRIDQEGILTKIDVEIPFMQHVDFVYLQDDVRTLVVFYRNRTTRETWSTVVTLPERVDMKEIFQDNLAIDQLRATLYPDIASTGNPRALDDAEWETCERFKDQLSPHHLQVGTYDTFQIPGGKVFKRKSVRDDFKLHKELYLKSTRTIAQRKRIAELPEELRAALPADPSLIEYMTHFHPTAELELVNAETNQVEARVPIAADLGPIGNLVTREKETQAFPNGHIIKKTSRTRARRMSGFRAGKIGLHNFPQHMMAGKREWIEDLGAMYGGGTDQPKFYGDDWRNGFWSRWEPNWYARLMHGTGGNLQMAKCISETVINSGTPVTRVVDKMFETIIEKHEAEHPGGTFFMTYPEPNDITEDYKESRLVYMQDGYVTIYTPKIVAVAGGVKITTIFVQRRRWSSSVAIGKIWIRPFLREQMMARVDRLFGRTPRSPITYTWGRMLEELLGCTWYMVGPAAISRFMSPVMNQNFGMNSFMAEGNLFPFVWLPQYLFTNRAYAHSIRKVGISWFDGAIRDPSIFFMQVPMFTETLFHLDDEHKGPFAVSALAGNVVTRRFLLTMMAFAAMNVQAGMIGLNRIALDGGNLLQPNDIGLTRDRYDFGNIMNTFWPFYNAVLIANGLELIFRGQWRVYREAMRKQTQENDQRVAQRHPEVITTLTPHVDAAGAILPSYASIDVIKQHIAALKRFRAAIADLETNIEKKSEDRKKKKDRLKMAQRRDVYFVKRLLLVRNAKPPALPEEPKHPDDAEIKAIEDILDGSTVDLQSLAHRTLILHNRLVSTARQLRTNHTRKLDGSHYTAWDYTREELWGFWYDPRIDLDTEPRKLIKKGRGR